MTITLNTTTTDGVTTCDDFTIASDLFETFMDDVASYTLTLVATINCSETEYTLEVDSDDVNGDGVDTPYSWDVPADLFEEAATTLDDGVYKLKLLLVEDSSGTTTPDIGCYIVDCMLKCTVRDFQAANTESTIWMWYNALVQGNDCDQCGCAESCALYEYIQELLNTSETNDCGCS